MIARIQTGRAEGKKYAVVSRHFDRLYRQPRELEDVIDATEGVHVEAVYEGGHDLSSADGRTHARVIGAFARGEAEKKSERSRSTTVTPRRASPARAPRVHSVSRLTASPTAPTRPPPSSGPLRRCSAGAPSPQSPVSGAAAGCAHPST